MFRIKTDIRQYKCETKDKVEKLIRNWVIRPTDLLYNTDQKEWLPIGEHPSFTQLFGVLDEQEQNTPDTVVTAQSPYRSENPSGVNGSAVKVEDANGEQSVEEEVTHIVDRASLEPDAPDSRETDVFEQEDIARTMGAEAPAPPSAPQGVEPPVREEVTTMTERTLEMLKITDEGDEVDAIEAPAEEVAPDDVEEDEVTGVREAADQEENSEAASEAPDPTEKLPAPEPEVSEPSEVVEPQPRLGRHDLPEELFATNEISAPEVREKLEMLDELADLSEPSETTNKTPVKQDGEWDRKLEEDSGLDETWRDIADDLPPSDESPAPEENASDAEEEELEDADETAGEDDEELAEIAELEEIEPVDDEDEDGELDDDTSEPHVDARDFVSEGYSLPLPYRVGPTANDIRLGLKTSRASTARKDRTYPLPQPKKLDEIHRHTFDLTPPIPRDQTLVFVALLLVVIAVIAALVSY